MSLANTSIHRPTFITCLIIVMLAVGTFSMQKLGVDLFPNVTFPVVTVTTAYPGAGPAEIETLISKPLEDELSTLTGIKRVSSINQEGVSLVIAEFSLETDIKFAESQIRDRSAAAKRFFPTDAKDPVIRRIDPSDQPIVTLAVEAELPPGDLFDLANERIKPKIEQLSRVGQVEVVGGRKREILVELDRAKLKARELSVSGIAQRLAATGENIPAGKVDQGAKEVIFRSLGQFTSLKDIENSLVSFYGSEVPTTLKDVGVVRDSLQDERSRAYFNGKQSLFINAYKQSGANTVAVADAILARVKKFNDELKSEPGSPKVSVIRDTSLIIRANIDDVKESILFGVILAVLVVFLFLGSGRSTIITGLALPNSLIGAFVLMQAAGFTINMMTLLALSLSVGLLVDDAIVVRENIFRHLEKGKSPLRAALDGTSEVSLAVIATTLTICAVFGPVAFLEGVVGQFFQQFGLTIVFAMAISLFDALTIAPMLSAYLAGTAHSAAGTSFWDRTVGRVLKGFSRFQDGLELKYETLLKFTMRRPFVVLLASFAVFVFSMWTIKFVPKTFLPAQENGEFSVSLDLPPGTSLSEMDRVAQIVDKKIRDNREISLSSLTVGGRNGEANVADFYVRLIPVKQRPGMTTSKMKEVIREQLKEVAYANPVVKDYDAIGGGQRPFNVNIIGSDQKEVERVATEYFEILKKNPGLKDADINYRPGKPEYQVITKAERAHRLGVSALGLGLELRAQVEGVTPAKYREKGLEYDVRLRLIDSQRDIRQNASAIWVPNINQNLIRMSDVAQGVETTGPAKITRFDRGRYIQISGDIDPSYGMSRVMDDIKNLATKEKPMPSGMRYVFVGQAENFQELIGSMITAMIFAVLFIYLILASLYESFVTPFTIMLALPLALCGCFVALAVTQESLNIFSMIGAIMLLGVATKNSILLVDYAQQLVAQGVSRADAMVQAGKTRLRPILMTTMALIAGTIPIAIGLNEASRQRTSMGVAIVGGLISSTLLTLVVIPAAYSFIDRYRMWSRGKMARLFGVNALE